MRLWRAASYASAAIVGAFLCWQIAIRASAPAALFNPDPQHISNRLYRQLHVRIEPGGKEYGFDALDPLLWSETKYLLSGKSHARALALADEFLRTHAERQIGDPIKRAIFQRDVWAVFDWADQPNEPGLPPQPYQAERAELMARLAPLVRGLALSPDELAALPDTYARAIRDREFPIAYDPAKPNQAFLPPDLFDPRGPWVCIGAPQTDLAAPLHDLSFTARSVFFVFARLPGGRDAALAYFKRLAEMDTPLFVHMHEAGWPDAMDVWNPDVPQFPVGTEFALVRRMTLPDRDGILRLTPMTESIQIRHYTDIPIVGPMESRDVSLAQRFQSPSEIELSRIMLFSGNQSGLRGVTATSDPFIIFPAMIQGFDEFEDKRMRAQHVSRFAACTGCHLGPGIQSMMSFSFRGNPGEGPVLSPRLAETTLQEESEKVLGWAQKQDTWKDLLRVWNSETRN
jgi:hypothetical protein